MKLGHGSFVTLARKRRRVRHENESKTDYSLKREVHRDRERGGEMKDVSCRWNR
jgi:hypothetical protein